MKLDHFRGSIIEDKVFTNGPSKNLWSKAFKKIELIGSAKIDHLASIFKTVFHKFYLVHSCPITGL